jgi:hypothetical protein
MQEVTRLIDLSEATSVLVRFHYTNQNVVPNGLRSLNRLSEQEMIRKRMKNSAPGHQVVQNLDRTQIAMLRVGLANNGMRLVDAHTLVEKKPGKTTKYITVLGFRAMEEGEIPPVLPEEAMEDLRAFSMKAIWRCHVWWNPNGVMIIELMCRQPGVKPLQALVIRDHWIVSMATEELVEQDDEDCRNASELLKILN